MSGFVHKFKEFVGLVPGEGYVEDEEICDSMNNDEDIFHPVQGQTEMDTIYNLRKKSNLKVLQHPSANSYEVMVVEPRSFEESLDIVNNLRDKKSIILNLHLLDAELSQRIVDFLSGATHAIDGHQQRIGEGVFIFAPSNVSISSETEKARVIRDAFWNQPH